ncbi:MAG: alpha-amylase family glycosyl hydrolase [Candidatus Kariarchaeaceae archaeon]|jgi:alpha-amylase
MQLRGTILQPWNYYTPRLNDDGKNLWQRLERDASTIKKNAFTAVWLPPASEATGGQDDVGYGIKNWYNLDNTKYGNFKQLIKACRVLKQEDIEVYHDQVLNHLMGGEIERNIWCLSVKMNNKNERVNDSCVWFRTDIPTSFPSLKPNHTHFDAFHPNDYECWALSGKKFDREANQDPLMGCDLDFDNIDLTRKLEEYGLWLKNEVNVGGYRFDAVKHIRPKGVLDFLTAMKFSEGKNLFAVGEYLDTNIDLLHDYIKNTYGQISLFDVPLQRKLVLASQQNNQFDMGTLLTRTLTREQPVLSVPFVHSHDDQPGIHGKKYRGHYIGEWFISQAYAIVLLRDEGYPMVSDVDTLMHSDMIKRYMLARRDCTYGFRHDRFDHNNTVGWAFSGGHGFDNSMAVVITNGDYGRKWLKTCRSYVVYRDLTDALHHRITTNEHGWAEFECPSRNTSVWVEESKYHYLLSLINS